MANDGHNLHYELMLGVSGDKSASLGDLRTTTNGIKEIYENIYNLYPNAIPQVFESGYLSGWILNPSKDFIENVEWVDAHSDVITSINRGVKKYSYSGFDCPDYINVFKQSELEIMEKELNKRQLKRKDIPINNKMYEILIALGIDDNGSLNLPLEIKEIVNKTFRGLSEEKNRYALNAIENDHSFMSLLKFNGLLHSSYIELNYEKMKDYYDRDAVYDMLLAYDVSNKDAYAVTELVSRGLGFKWIDVDEAFDKLFEEGVWEEFSEAVENIQYLFPRAHVIEYLIILMQMIWLTC